MAISCILRQIPCLSATVKCGIERVIFEKKSADKILGKGELLEYNGDFLKENQ